MRSPSRENFFSSDLSYQPLSSNAQRYSLSTPNSSLSKKAIKRVRSVHNLLQHRNLISQDVENNTSLVQKCNLSQVKLENLDMQNAISNNQNLPNPNFTPFVIKNLKRELS